MTVQRQCFRSIFARSRPAAVFRRTLSSQLPSHTAQVSPNPVPTYFSPPPTQHPPPQSHDDKSKKLRRNRRLRGLAYSLAALFLSYEVGVRFQERLFPEPYPDPFSLEDSLLILDLERQIDDFPEIQSARDSSPFSSSVAKTVSPPSPTGSNHNDHIDNDTSDPDGARYILLPKGRLDPLQLQLNPQLKTALWGFRGACVERWLWDRERSEAINYIYFGGGLCGWPGMVHGGAIASWIGDAAELAVLVHDTATSPDGLAAYSAITSDIHDTGFVAGVPLHEAWRSSPKGRLLQTPLSGESDYTDDITGQAASSAEPRSPDAQSPNPTVNDQQPILSSSNDPFAASTISRAIRLDYKRPTYANAFYRLRLSVGAPLDAGSGATAAGFGAVGAVGVAGNSLVGSDDGPIQASASSAASGSTSAPNASRSASAPNASGSSPALPSPNTVLIPVHVTLEDIDGNVCVQSRVMVEKSYVPLPLQVTQGCKRSEDIDTGEMSVHKIYQQNCTAKRSRASDTLSILN